MKELNVQEAMKINGGEIHGEIRLGGPDSFAATIWRFVRKVYIVTLHPNETTWPGLGQGAIRG
ncbi:MAG: hypothetical protein A3J83_06145 [Elusimicrobia bacterium RIFOXYA2_FULL_40_6]|nr:MAG: hypothetical protein A3J83_06145 [Elusimicrobia bacterium RIFOXYA2_FULL_40_6]